MKETSILQIARNQKVIQLKKTKITKTFAILNGKIDFYKH